MDYINRMEFELKDLQMKIGLLASFLEREKENPKLTNPYQRELLEKQQEFMSGYARILETRISYELERVKSNG